MKKKNIIIIIIIVTIILLLKNIKNKKELFTEIDGKICNKDSDCSSNYCLPSTDNKKRCLRKNIGECKKVNYPNNPGTCNTCKRGFKLTPVINGNWKCNLQNSQEIALKNSLAISDKLFDSNNNELYLPIELRMNWKQINVNGKLISNNVAVKDEIKIEGRTTIHKLGSKNKKNIVGRNYDIFTNKINNMNRHPFRFNINNFYYHIGSDGKLLKQNKSSNAVQDFNVHKKINHNDYLRRNGKPYIKTGNKNTNLVYIKHVESGRYFDCGSCKHDQDVTLKPKSKRDKFYLKKL